MIHAGEVDIGGSGMIHYSSIGGGPWQAGNRHVVSKSDQFVGECIHLAIPNAGAIATQHGVEVMNFQNVWIHERQSRYTNRGKFASED